MTADIKFYLSLFFRRIHYFMFFTIAGTALGFYLAFHLPAIYRAEARLVVEAAQIPGDLAASTVQTSAVDILEVIKQRLLARDNLLAVADEFGVYANTPDLAPDRRAIDMMRRITIELPMVGMPGGTSVVRVAFDAPTGEMSMGVTNTIVDQIIAQNTALRTGVAAQTLKFFRDEVARLDAELATQGNLILTFQEANKDSLPDGLAYQRTRQTSLQERLLQMERELSSLRDRRARLVAIFDRTGRTDVLGGSMTPEQRQLQQLKDELASALAIYSPQNPRITSLRAQVAALEAANIRLGLGNQTDPNMTAFDFQVDDIDGQIKFVAEQARAIEADLATLAVNIDATPSNAIALGTLQRDYENIRLQYTQATAALAEARTGDQIETQSRGARVTVTDRAVLPSKPASPNRKLIVAAGMGGGIGLGFSLFLLLEALNRSIRRSSELTTGLGIIPFGTIPYITTQAEVLRRRLIVLGSVLLVLIALSGIIYLALQERTLAAGLLTKGQAQPHYQKG